jgi:hypothetical protein
MSDNKKKPGNPDKSRINVNEKYELTDWSRKYGVTPTELKKAVAKVGTQASDVEAFLNKNSKAAH